MTCDSATSPTDATGFDIRITTSSGVGSLYEIWLIGQTIQPRLLRLPFLLDQNATIREITEGDKYTIIVLSHSKGEQPMIRRQEFTSFSDPPEPYINESCCFSTETAVSFFYGVRGLSHGFIITLVTNRALPY